MLRIPKLRLEVPILPGTDDRTLDRAVGHIEDTAAPGADGNSGIAGHRDGFFRGLKDIAPGDVIELDTLDGKQIYRVERTWVVDPEDVSVLDPTPSRALTLVTCYPFYYVGPAPQRFIVRAVQVPATNRAAASVSCLFCAHWKSAAVFGVPGSRRWWSPFRNGESLMSRAISRMMLAVAVVCGMAVVSQAGQTTTTSTETKTFEVIAVDGNQLVVKLPEGTREMTVPDDFRFTVNGKQLSVAELKPGMKGTATITTRTTVTPVTVTEVKNGTVMQATGATVIVRTDEGFKDVHAGRTRQARREDHARRQAREDVRPPQGRSADRDHHHVEAAEGPDRRRK